MQYKTEKVNSKIISLRFFSNPYKYISSHHANFLQGLFLPLWYISVTSAVITFSSKVP